MDLPPEIIGDIILYIVNWYDDILFLNLCKIDPYFIELINYMDISLDFACMDIDDDDLKFLSGIHSLHIFCCNITDNGLKHLEGIKNIALQGCENITDEGLKNLVGVRYIDLWGCSKVTDEGIKVLENSVVSR